MSHIKEYKIVYNMDVLDLQNDVNKSLEEGWELCGELKVMVENDKGFWCFQPMIKLKEAVEFKTNKYID